MKSSLFDSFDGSFRNVGEEGDLLRSLLSGEA